MATKFIRGMSFTGAGTNAKASYMLKFIYEFWGYCINGGASLSTPGGFAAITPFGGSLPTNFMEGTSVLASGSDGYTNATTVFRYDGYTDFYAASAPFLSSMVGKQLVMWKAGSGSSEDSIYQIIAYKSPTNIVINVNNGGTPSMPDGYKPSVTNRVSINYRVVDISAGANATGVADGNYMVMQFDPTGINTGQANSQVQLILAGSNIRFDHKISPGGTWNGSAFSDATATTTPNINGGTTAFFNGTGGGSNMSILLVGDKDFLIGHSRDAGNTSTLGFQFHIEIPIRLYSQAQDTNPIVVNINGYGASNQFTSTITTGGYGGGWVMKCFDGNARAYRCAVKALTGDGNPNLFNPPNGAYPPGNNLSDVRPGLNPMSGNILNSSCILCLPGVATQYSLARVMLNRTRIANIFMPAFTRFSSNGDFILITQGVAIPWDKTVLPYSLFPY